MRRVLTILAPVVALTTLVVFSVLYLQYRVRIRGHSLGLPHPNLAPRPSNILGVNIHLFSDSSETINNTFDIISDAGFGWVRQTFYWEPEEFDWSAADTIINSANERNLQIIAVLTGIDVPHQTQKYTQFAYKFASRYSNQVDVYQIGDEPNLASGWGSTPSAVEYSRLSSGSSRPIGSPCEIV